MSDSTVNGSSAPRASVDPAPEPSGAHADRYVVGYVANDRGRDALELAAFLARGRDVELVVTIVVPHADALIGARAIAAGSDRAVDEQVEAWLDEALALVPEGVRARGKRVVALTEAHGLLDAASEEGASLIVVGSRADGLMSRFAIGSVASALLHAAHVPVALAPSGFAATGGVERVTAVVGARPGASHLMSAAVQRALHRSVPVRVVELVISGVGVRGDGRPAGLPRDDVRGEDVELVVHEGEGFDEALEEVDWREGDLVLLGSSRIGAEHRVFLGRRAYRLLHAVSVPALVVPRGYVGLGGEDE